MITIELDQDLSNGTIEIVEYDIDSDTWELEEGREVVNNTFTYNNSTIIFTPTQAYYQIRYYENSELVKTSKWIHNDLTGTFNDNNTTTIFTIQDDENYAGILGGYEEYNEETEESIYEPPTFEGYIQMATLLADGPEEPSEPNNPEELIEYSPIPWQNNGYDLSNLKIGIWYGYGNTIEGEPDQIIDVAQDGAFSGVLDVESDYYIARWKIINSGADSPLYELYGQQGS